MTVAILIVNWNGGDLLTRCLESLLQQRRRPDHIVVVDNASTDDSLTLAEPLLRDVELIRLPSNVGFARANNIAAQAALQYDALVLLNPDAIAHPEWLQSATQDGVTTFDLTEPGRGKVRRPGPASEPGP